MVKATVIMERIALKWRDLAERRRDHFIDLYRSGRWKHYYTSEEMLTELRDATAIAQRWAKIAPRPEEREQVKQQLAAEPRKKAA